MKNGWHAHPTSLCGLRVNNVIGAYHQDLPDTSLLIN